MFTFSIFIKSLGNYFNEYITIFVEREKVIDSTVNHDLNKMCIDTILIIFNNILILCEEQGAIVCGIWCKIYFGK